MKNYIIIGLALLCGHLSFAQSGRNKAEIFIQIADRGNFTIYVDDEFAGSSNGKFRFYDVYNNMPMISILQGTKRIYSKKVDIRFGERTILNFSMRDGLSTLKSLKIYRNGQYALDDFSDYTKGYNTGIVPPRPVPAQDDFEFLCNAVKKEPFDDGKVKLIQIYSANTFLSTAQTIALLKTFSNDDKKLSLAKSLMPAISDVTIYYTLTDAFTFISSKDEFLAYINANGPGRSNAGMRQTEYDDLKSRLQKEPFDDGKTKLIQAAIQYKSPSSQQMTGLLQLFSFDEKALECAKLALNFVVDKQKYYTVKDAFRFRSTQNAFLDFLARK